MVNKNFSELTDEKLIKRRDLLKGFLIGIGIVWLLLIVFFVYIFLSGTAKVQIAMLIPLFALPATLTPVFISLGLLNKEIASRGLK